ncbi:hypothetical protein [Streptomyces formicae]
MPRRGRSMPRLPNRQVDDLPPRVQVASELGVETGGKVQAHSTVYGDYGIRKEKVYGYYGTRYRNCSVGHKQTDVLFRETLMGRSAAIFAVLLPGLLLTACSNSDRSPSALSSNGRYVNISRRARK